MRFDLISLWESCWTTPVRHMPSLTPAELPALGLGHYKGHSSAGGLLRRQRVHAAAFDHEHDLREDIVATRSHHVRMQSAAAADRIDEMAARARGLGTPRQASSLDEPPGTRRLRG